MEGRRGERHNYGRSVGRTDGRTAARRAQRRRGSGSALLAQTLWGRGTAVSGRRAEIAHPAQAGSDGGTGGAEAGAGIADVTGGGGCDGDGDKARGRPVAIGLTPLPSLSLSFPLSVAPGCQVGRSEVCACQGTALGEGRTTAR